MVSYKSRVGSLLVAALCVTVASTQTFAATPTPPPMICIDSECETTSPSTAESNAIKFNPGHYLWVDGIVYLDSNYATKKANILALLDALANEPSVQGIQIDLTWAVLEGRTAGDYSAGFQLVDEILARAAMRKKRVMIDIMNYQIGYFHGPGKISFPAYLLSSTYGQLQSITSSSAYRYGGVVNIPAGVDANYGTGQINSALWESAVANRYIALIKAYGARYNDSAYLEMISPITNLSFTNTYNNYGYSKSAMVTQVTRVIKATRAAFPNTACRLWIDYFGSDAENAQIISEAVAANCAVGGNDVLPKEDVAADRIFNGEATGIDYRSVVPWVSNVAVPELCGKEGTFTPTQLFDHAMNGKSGMSPMRPQYFTWIQNTWACAEGGPQRWSTGMLPFIQSISGAISNGRDSTRRSPSSVKASYCPTGYEGRCK